jgi:hypothetical protein
LKNKIYNLLVTVCVIPVAVLIAGTTATGADPAKILILPFAVHAEKDLAYLQKGIEDMLSTRLIVEGKTVLINPQVADAVLSELTGPPGQVAVSAGEALGADYVVLGSLTVILESISTDVRFIDVHQKKSVVTFNKTGSSQADLIGHINLFAQQVRQTVFDQKSTAYQTQPAPKKQETTGAYPENPEKMMQGRQQSKTVIYSTTESQAEIPESLWRSKRFKEKLVSFAVGDVDGDGLNESVLVSHQTIHIFRFFDGRFKKIASIKGGGFTRYIHVDVADINANGVEEIFLSNVTATSGPLSSFALEWDGSGYRKIVENANWYFKTVNHKDAGKILYGQRRTTDEIFRPGIFKLQWANGRYEPGEKLPLPFNINIYGFTHGDALNNQTNAYIVYKGGNHITVLDGNGKEMWKSGEDHGGNATYFDYFPTYNMGERERNTPQRFYLPLPLHVVDLNQDGLNEVLTIKNEQALYGVFARIRSYKNGRLTSLIWDGGGLYPQWQTREFTKYVSDCVVADLNNDGRDEIAFLVVSEPGSTLKKPKSFISTIDVQRELVQAPATK